MQVYGLLERGAMQRATGTTKMNELSSRSHAVFIIIIEKSTVTSTHEADGDEMEQFRGLAPGVALITCTSGMPSLSVTSMVWRALVTSRCPGGDAGAPRMCLRTVNHSR